MDESRSVPENCLSDATVADLVARRLDPSAAERVREHLDRCPECLELVSRSSALADSDGPADDGQRWGGRYVARSVLGRGGMAVVYLAWDDVLEREVALKVLRPRILEAGPGVTERLIRESKVMAQVEHPNVVRVYDAATDDGTFFVAMEHVEGSTLRAWLDAQPREWRDVLRCLVGAGRGLMAAHEAGIVHRDFKPDNVLVDTAGTAMVTDFGLARVVADPTDDKVTSIPAQGQETAAGAGTPGYIAPEQLKTSRVDVRADVFSFCVSAFECLFGKRPFPDGPSERREAIAAGQIRVGPRRDVPRSVRAAILAGLAEDPADRPQTLGPVLAAFERPLRRRRRFGIYAGLLALTGVLGGAVFLARSDDARPCERPPDRLDQLLATSNVEAAFQNEGPDGMLAWARWRPRLDGVVAELDKAYLDACQAEDRSPAQLAIEQACLVQQRLTVASLLDYVIEGDTDALDGLDRLGSPTPCIAEGIEAANTEGDAVRPAFRADMARLVALELVGRSKDERASAAALLERAQADGDTLGEAWALMRVASATKRADPNRARQRYARAGELAEALGLHSLATRAWVAAATVAQKAADKEGSDAALDRASTAVAQVRPIDAREELSIHLLWLRGMTALGAGDLDAARTALDRSIALATVHRPRQVVALMPGQVTLERVEGNLDRAIERLETLVRHAETQYGPSHKNVRGNLWLLGDSLRARGRLPEARKTVDQLLEVSAEMDGNLRADYVWMSAHVDAALGELDRARASAEEVERLRGPSIQPARRRDLLKLRATIERIDGNLDAARELLEQARAAAAELAKKQPRANFGTDLLLAEVLARKGEHERGLELARPVHEAQRAHRPRSPSTGWAASVMGWLLLGRATTAPQALEMFRAAVPLLSNPYQKAWAKFGMALSLVATGGSEEEARALATGARQTLAEIPTRYGYELAEIDRFLG